MKSGDFFNLPNPTRRVMALEFTQPLTEMGIKDFPGVKTWPVRKANNLPAICEPIV
jgi:hypothetical protein